MSVVLNFDEKVFCKNCDLDMLLPYNRYNEDYNKHFNCMFVYCKNCGQDNVIKCK